MTEALLCKIIVYGFMALMTLPVWFAALNKYEFRRQDRQAAREAGMMNVIENWRTS